MRILILINQTKLLELVAQGVCVDNAQGEGGLGGELKIGLASKVFTPNFSFSRRKMHTLDHLLSIGQVGRVSAQEEISVQLIFQNSAALYLCLFVGQVKSPDHSDQLSERSHVSNIAPSCCFSTY